MISKKSNSAKNDLKKIKLFNSFCYLWYVVAVLLILGRAYKYQLFIDRDITIHLLFICAITCLQIIHFYGYHKFSRHLFIFLLILSIYIFCNYMVPGRMREFYYLLVPSVVLIFIDTNFFKYFFVLLAFICFTVPNLIYGYYDIWSFNDPTQSLLFFSIFFIVNYFKKINLKKEKELKEKKDELERINTFQSQFFINVSHEIRTPLTLMKNQTTLLNEVSTAEKSSIIKQMNLQIDTISKIVDDVLDLSKMESDNFSLNAKQISINKLLHRLHLNFEPLFKQKKILFEYHKNNINYYALGDITYLERALGNIILNALKYTERNGTVKIFLKKSAKSIIIDIKDSGIGIFKKDLDKIFNRFYQADNDINKAGGSGVGLAFSKEIIRRHKGTITVKSKVGLGSNFRIVLPFVKLMEEVIQNKNSVKPSLDIVNNVNTKYTILLVDDNYEMRQYLKQILHSYVCWEAENGVEALEILKSNNIDFVLTDYMMPKMNGIDFIKTLKKQNYQMPVLMLTARGDNESKLNVLRLGIDDYLQKPFEKEELLIRIENTLRNYDARKEYIEKYENIKTNSSTKWLSNIQQYVYKECGNPNLDQTDISLKFGLSKSTLYRKIKGETGLTPNEFITEVKLQKARNLIEKEHNISLKRLALEVGFLHTSYFSNIYKKRFGTKPK